MKSCNNIKASIDYTISENEIIILTGLCAHWIILCVLFTRMSMPFLWYRVYVMINCDKRSFDVAVIDVPYLLPYTQLIPHSLQLFDWYI